MLFVCLWAIQASVPTNDSLILQAAAPGQGDRGFMPGSRAPQPLGDVPRASLSPSGDRWAACVGATWPGDTTRPTWAAAQVCAASCPCHVLGPRS